MSESDQIPRSEILVDWEAFRLLPSNDRRSFVEFVVGMEQGDRFNRSGPGAVAWATVDLSEYSDYAEFVASLKKVGKSFYEGKKAENRGYYSKFFDERTFVGDIVEINTSTAERQGRPMSDAYLRTVDQLGGYLEESKPPTAPEQSVFWHRYFGTFRASPGRCQGPVVVDEQLVSYSVVHRYGNFSHYHTILGHQSYLQDGVAHKMHLDFVKTVIDARDRAHSGDDADASLLGLRFICYAGYYSGAGLTRWKKSNLFRPRYFQFDVAAAMERPTVGGLRRAPTRQQTASRMIRIGDYDSFDKWDLLRRHWEDKEPLSDLGDDRFGRPRLPHWQAVALASGREAVFNYIHFKANSFTERGLANRPIEDDTATITQEMALLWREYGNGGLAAMLRQFADAITETGFAAATYDRFSNRLVDRLKDVFKSAALESLQWTDDLGEIPTIELLRTQKSTTFPAELIRAKRNVLCLFLARFYGREAIIDVHDIFPRHVVLVDDDVRSMDDVKLIYPEHWSYVASDYVKFLEHADVSGAKFDLVICDGWTSMAKELAWDYLPTLMGICTDMLITNYTIEMLDELGVTEYETKRLSDAVSQKAGVEVVFLQMIRKTSSSWWAVIGRK